MELVDDPVFRMILGGEATTLDEAEEIVHRLETEDEVKARIAAGEFGQALHVASFYLVGEHLRARDG